MYHFPLSKTENDGLSVINLMFFYYINNQEKRSKKKQ